MKIEIKAKTKDLISIKAWLNQKITKIQSNELTAKMGQGFRDYAITQTQENGLGLEPISAVSARVSSKGNHAPMYGTGQLLEAMELKTEKGYTDVGYMSDKLYPGSTQSYKQIANMQTTGFRINLYTSGGWKVRGWFKGQGVSLSSKMLWFNVPPRPFLQQAAYMYEASGELDVIIKDFMRSL